MRRAQELLHVAPAKHSVSARTNKREFSIELKQEMRTKPLDPRGARLENSGSRSFNSSSPLACAVGLKGAAHFEISGVLAFGIHSVCRIVYYSCNFVHIHFL